MKLLYRLGYYLGGFSVGLILLTIILKGKKASCNYGPSDRVINNISKKNININLIENSNFDSILFHKFLKKASVDFDKSDTKKDSCKIYYLQGYLNKKVVSLSLENCQKNINLISLDFKNE
tara:strand:- start:556 stop:918 length:363 start_codon:yes stop_codon:yes gene_type:complete